MKARRMITILAWFVGVLAVLVFVGWLGFQVKPAPFPRYTGEQGEIRKVPVPTGLPKPVERFYRLTYGEEMPVVETAVLTGRASMKPFGIAMPSRYRFTHVAGKDYRHYIEACWFGIPVMKVNERYVDGKSHIRIPIIGEDSGPKVEQAANLGLWAESWQMPSLFLTDPRVRWEPIDDVTALLVVPFKDGVEERFVVRFDPRTGLVTRSESMRYRDSNSDDKVLWMTQAEEYGRIDGLFLNTVGSAMWLDAGEPWATFTLEEIEYNVDVTDYVRAEGI